MGSIEYAAAMRQGGKRLAWLLIGAGLLGCEEGGSEGSGGAAGGDAGSNSGASSGGTSAPAPSADCTWRVAESRRDEGCLGTDLTCTVHLYDERGYEIGTHQDYGCDGDADNYCETHELDAMGRKISSQASSSCNDVVNDCREFSYAADGEITERIDYGCDGTVSCWRYREDENGRELYWETDSGCDGVAENCRSGEYDEQGRTLRREYDSDCDGTPETCLTYEYSADGTMSQGQSDEGCDGVPEDCSEHAVDAEGRFVRDVSFVSCGDDTVQSCTEHLYDDHGNHAGIEYDSDCDGTPNNCAYTTWECAPD